MGLCAGLFAAAPIVTLGNYFRELVFAWYWGQRNRPVEPAGLSEVAYEGDLVTLAQADRSLMLRLNRWRAPRWVRWWMLGATRAGDGWLWGAIGIAVLFSQDAMRFHAIEASACAIAVGIVIFHKVKRVCCRTRPRDIEPHCWAHIVTRDKFSFPSGHSTTAFALALSLGSFYPEILLPLLVLAANVAISRVIVGMHFLSDVLAGAGWARCWVTSPTGSPSERRRAYVPGCLGGAVQGRGSPARGPWLRPWG